VVPEQRNRLERQYIPVEPGHVLVEELVCSKERLDCQGNNFNIVHTVCNYANIRIQWVKPQQKKLGGMWVLAAVTALFAALAASNVNTLSTALKMMVLTVKRD
jgi:hypothetical protein